MTYKIWIGIHKNRYAEPFYNVSYELGVQYILVNI